MDRDPIPDHPCVPCAEALVAGTVALMTTWADPCRTAGHNAAAQRGLIARKIVSNLYFLREHPALSPTLRQVMALAHERWAALAAQHGSEAVVASAATAALH